MLQILVSTTDNKAAQEKLMRELQRAKNSYVTIGLHEDAGTYDDGTSIVDVGFWNEFGTVNAPQRSFIRETIDENLNQIDTWREIAINNVIDGKWTTYESLQFIGKNIKKLIEDKIKSNVPPPNAPSVAQRKADEGKPASTLMDSQAMLHAIAFKVVLNG